MDRHHLETILYPFGGFFVVAFLAALFQKGNELCKRVIDRLSEMEEDVEQEIREFKEFEQEEGHE